MSSINEEFLVSVCHQLALITSLPFVHTACRIYRLGCIMSQAEMVGRSSSLQLSKLCKWYCPEKDKVITRQLQVNLQLDHSDTVNNAFSFAFDMCRCHHVQWVRFQRCALRCTIKKSCDVRKFFKKIRDERKFLLLDERRTFLYALAVSLKLSCMISTHQLSAILH